MLLGAGRVSEALERTSDEAGTECFVKSCGRPERKLLGLRRSKKPERELEEPEKRSRGPERMPEGPLRNLEVKGFEGL